MHFNKKKAKKENVIEEPIMKIKRKKIKNKQGILAPKIKWNAFRKKENESKHQGRELK